MRKIALLLLLTGSVVIESCKKDRWVDAVVLRDCTGTYLRIGELDYKVCNLGKVEAISNRTNVSVRIEKIDACDCNQGVIVCEMLHLHNGWLYVQEIK